MAGTDVHWIYSVGKKNLFTNKKGLWSLDMWMSSSFNLFLVAEFFLILPFQNLVKLFLWAQITMS